MLTQNELKEKMTYNESTGVFTWTDEACANVAGKRAGCEYTKKHNGKSYRNITINRTKYLEHRLAWMFVNGEFPSSGLDHIDGNGRNNAIENLRIATPLENNMNMRISKKNTSGFTGVSWCSKQGKWRVQIRVNGKQVSVGRYAGVSEAVKARVDAEVTNGYHINHGTYRPL